MNDGAAPVAPAPTGDGFIPHGSPPAAAPNPNQPAATPPNNENDKNNPGGNRKPMFDWVKGLVRSADTDPPAQPTPEPQRVIVQQPVAEPTTEEKLQSYLKDLPVAKLELSEEQLTAFHETGDLSVINEQLAQMQQQNHLQTLEAVDTILQGRLDTFKREILQQSRANNLGVTLLDHVKAQFPDQTADPILGPVVEGAVKTMFKNGATDRQEVIDGVKHILTHMGANAVPGAGTPGLPQHQATVLDPATAFNPPTEDPTVDLMDKPGDWLNFMKGPGTPPGN